MSKPKIMTVYGTRPEAIKVAPVIKALEKDSRFETVVVSTGQHKGMLSQVNSMFKIKPDHDLGLMRPGQGLNEIVSRVLLGLDEIIDSEQPQAVIVQGDTSTAMAAALAGYHSGAKVIHLEAGLRTGNLRSPFPEEANRRMIGQIADLHLAPTPKAKRNLLKEGVCEDHIVVTGNSVIDSLIEATSWETSFQNPRLVAAVESDSRIVIVTTHRRENIAAMTEIGSAVRDLAKEFPETIFVLPLHLNPLVGEAVMLPIEELPNIVIVPPLPYDQFTRLLSNATLVLTDSGGIQEEAPALGKPVLIMRENTERPEAIVAGTAKLVGTDRERIVAETRLLLNDDAVYRSMANAVNPYGDGRAAERMIAAIAALLGSGARKSEFSLQANGSFSSAYPFC